VEIGAFEVADAKHDGSLTVGKGSSMFDNFSAMQNLLHHIDCIMHFTSSHQAASSGLTAARTMAWQPSLQHLHAPG
jgi:hypothetical protein